MCAPEPNTRPADDLEAAVNQARARGGDARETVNPRTRLILGVLGLSYERGFL